MELSKKNIALLHTYSRGTRISKCGKIIITKRGKLEQRYFVNGYPVMGVRIDKKVYKVGWHRLQAFQKYGDEIFKEGIVVRHKNGIKTDCSFDNILIGTQKDNSNDIPEEQRRKYAINASNHIKKHNSKDIISYYNNVKSYKKTMEKFNISSKGTLHYILNSKKEYDKNSN